MGANFEGPTIWYKGGEEGMTNASLDWWQGAENVQHSHLQQS